jgi:hypothetical protein
MRRGYFVSEIPEKEGGETYESSDIADFHNNVE